MDILATFEIEMGQYIVCVLLNFNKQFIWVQYSSNNGLFQIQTFIAHYQTSYFNQNYGTLNYFSKSLCSSTDLSDV